MKNFKELLKNNIIVIILFSIALAGGVCLYFKTEEKENMQNIFEEVENNVTTNTVENENTEEAKKAEATAKAIFTGGDAANMPTAKLEADSFTDDEIDAINLVFGAGLATTKSEARRTIQQGGVSVDGEKVADIAAKFPKSMFEGDGVVVKKGKKSFVKVSVN